jgi:hypothetical protein
VAKRKVFAPARNPKPIMLPASYTHWSTPPGFNSGTYEVYTLSCLLQKCKRSYSTQEEKRMYFETELTIYIERHTCGSGVARYWTGIAIVDIWVFRLPTW